MNYLKIIPKLCESAIIKDFIPFSDVKVVISHSDIYSESDREDAVFITIAFIDMG